MRIKVYKIFLLLLPSFSVVESYPEKSPGANILILSIGNRRRQQGKISKLTKPGRHF